MENLSLYTFRTLSVLSLTVILSACGGGGGSTGPVKEPAPSSASSLKASSSKSSLKASSKSSAKSSSQAVVSSSEMVASSVQVISSSAAPSSLASSSESSQLSSSNFELPPSSSSVADVSSSISSSEEASSSSVDSSSSEEASSSSESSSSLFSSSSSSVLASSSSKSSSSVSQVRFHLRGTHNGWAEGDLLTPVAGSTTTLEICRNFTASDKGGGPRFKVDPNGAWGSDSFPASDTAASGWTRIVVKNDTSKTIVSLTQKMAANCAVASSSLSSKSSSSSSSLLSSSSSSVISSSSSSSTAVAHDLRSRTAYYVMLDRFNGTALNASTLPSSPSVADWKKYWGGDIDGLIAKLPYLKSLGVSAVVVSSLVDNTALGYHGFWAKDFYALDEHLGNGLDKVKELKAEMAALDMKLIMEINLNNASGEAPNPGVLLKEGQPVTDVDSFANGVIKGWYRNSGSIADGEWFNSAKYLTKSVSGRPDFIHALTGAEPTPADEYLIGAAKFWMADGEGVDGFRIHLTKFVEPNFITRFSNAVREENPEAYVVGNWSESAGDIPLVKAFVKAGYGSELMDIDLRNHLEAAIAGNDTMVELSAHLKARQTDLGEKASLQGVYLDSSSDSRTSVVLRTGRETSRGLGKGMSQAKGEARQNIGMAMVMTLPGVPVIYYGTEENAANFTANADGQVGADPYNREKLAFAATPKPAFDLIKQLSQLRHTSSAIQMGGYEERWVNTDVLVYQREAFDGDCAVIAINRGPAMTASINVKKLCLMDASYDNWLNPAETPIVVSGGVADIKLKENQVIVLYPSH